MNLLAERFSEQETVISELRENFTLVQAQMAHLKAEDLGWLRLQGGLGVDENTGISLDTLKEASTILREAIAGSPLPKRANDLRYSYTFGKPFIFPEVNQDADVMPSRGAKKKEQAFFDKPLNQRYAFNEEAQQMMNSSTSTDGMYLFLGDDTTREGRAIPISEITGLYLNPDFNDEVWGYQRTWTSQDSTGEVTTKVEWYLTDRFSGNVKPKSLGATGERVSVSQTKTIIDFVASPQTGFSLGIPDLMAAHIWNKKYLSNIAQGEEVNEVLGTYAAKVKVQSKAGAANVGVKTGKAGKGGPKAFAYGEGNSIDVFSSLGKTYDFDGLRPLAAMYAAAAGVSVVDLLASPSAAGASYGSAQALQPSERRSIESRREQWAAWYERLFAWGTGRSIRVTPAPLEEVEPYRKAQILGLAWNSGNIHPDEIRPEILKLAGITSRHDSSPEGVLLPNNRNSWERSDIDPKDGPAPSSGGTGTATSASSPDQGRSDGTGGAGSSLNSDTRTDTIESLLGRMQSDEKIAELTSLVERLEAAVAQVK